KNARVSITKLTNDFEPACRWNPIESFLAIIFNYFYNTLFLEKIEKELDYIGVDYYFHNRMVWHPPFIKNKNKKVNDLGWEIYPKGIYHALKSLKKFNKPIIVLENGLADAKDKHRKDFINDHLYYVHKAIEEGIDIKGYFHWSLLDNFEWAEGWAPKFGLFKVDRETFEREPRPSAKAYSKICKNNSLEI
ncbi:family 1 glycosylhydrolase, partial [Candidatus Falkowbacteria bacterium]|nr:family 1 glycosylhydrolase [Candidatus Falkowbacteria bacterium]